MARRHHRFSNVTDTGFTSVAGSGGDSDKCAFYFYNNDNYLTQDLSLHKVSSPTNISLEYSANGVNWTPYTIGTNISISPGSYIYIRNTSDTYTGFSTSTRDFYIFGVTSNGGSNIGGKNMIIGGNIKSLLCRNWDTTINLSDYCFIRLFGQHGNLYSDAAPVQWVYGSNNPNHIDFVLPFDALYPYCYSWMFAVNNYMGMSSTVIERSTIEQRSSYNGVLRLTGNMTNATCCFVNMFASTRFFIRGGLSKPALWIDMSGITGTMPEAAFEGMFSGCENLYSTTQVMQDLDWSFGGNGSIAAHGFRETFINCTSLEENPFMREIRYKNNIITPGPYYSDAFDDMFMEIYESKASIGEFGFSDMFNGCIMLRQGFLPPHAKLISTNGNGHNMHCMYYGCTRMKWLQYFHGNPILPAGYNYVSGGYWRDNPLAPACYAQMFYWCIDLLEAPILPADSDHMAEGCYAQMFYGAQKISYVKMLGISNSTYTGDWLTGAAPVGTIVKAAASDGTDLWSGAPSGWSSFNTYTEPFWIKCLSDKDNLITINLNKTSSASDLALKYRKDSASTWTSITVSSTRGLFDLNPGERMFLMYSGNSSQNWSVRPNTGSTYNRWSFSSTPRDSSKAIYYSVGGVLYTLQWPDGFNNSSGAIPTSFGNFNYLFNNGGSSGPGDTHLMYAQELDINSRLSLTGGNIDQGHNTVFQYAFAFCTNLIYPPAHTGGTIHTRTTSESAVSYTYTFSHAFRGCTKLRESPILGTRTVYGNRRPYYYMFYNCTSLKKIFTNQTVTSSYPWNSGSSISNWVYGVPSGGNFYTADDIAVNPSESVSSMPSGWTLKKEIFSSNTFTHHDPNLIYYLVERKNGGGL